MDMARLYDTIGCSLDRIMANPPARDVGGGVFVVHHIGTYFRWFSVVHITAEHGVWESGWILSREEADLVAEMVALRCKAKLIPEVEI